VTGVAAVRPAVGVAAMRATTYTGGLTFPRWQRLRL
jgi:hypothetical protein